MWSRVAAVVLAVTLGTVAGAACDGPDRETVSREARVYVATIRDVLAEQPPPPEPDVLPVVYVVGVGETRIAADVQAQVVSELDEVADIRFADQRSEAMLAKEEHAPVREGGVLVAIGELPPEADPVELPIEVYRSEEDWSKVVLTLAGSSSQWTVTSSSVVPAADR
jgi:hypothetical protein